MVSSKAPLFVLVGPTAVGKTALSLRLALHFNGEIVSGDSMQVYKGMDIGTAKVSPEERRLVPHHLIDIRLPNQPYSVADFQRDATKAIGAIHRRGRLPLLVGGTGLYIRSVTHQYRFVKATKEDCYRLELEEYGRLNGLQSLHRLLEEHDPETAARLHPHDVKRIIRALEVQHLTGIPFSQWQKEERQKESPYQLLILGLWMERNLLYAQIGHRVDQMVAKGLIEEVEGLLKQGYDESLPAMQGLGYKEILRYLKGQSSREEAIDEIKKRTRHFAKRQITWFCRQHNVQWIDITHIGWEAQFSKICQKVAGNIDSVEEYT